MILSGWAEFALALVVFMASHFLPRMGGLRETLIAKIGRGPYFAGYGIVSLVVLLWLIGSAIRAPFIELWDASEWTRKVPTVVTPFAMFLAVIGIGTRWPYILGSKTGMAFDPANPGLVALTRHPVLWALALWSAAHLPPNGDLAHLLLFGGFAGMSLAAMPMFDGRAKNAIASDDAVRAFQAAPVLSLAPLFEPTWLIENRRDLAWRLAIAVAIWAAAFGLHSAVIGVSPSP
ncbi:MAG: NnrU family protein [Pseudotabrizicola sp.]|uniref:NnrU family protein n=1 Tax=Pseudotabrizicola sp. TaxID=2939647 RepID=UPI002727AEED|nr:NnrU family protein [Pseudotabrizicola sp.]MDO9638898.1 NnrU family protein [Pseudotabrizicola sp.]